MAAFLQKHAGWGMALIIFAVLFILKSAFCAETNGPLTSETVLGHRLTNRESDNLKHIQQIL